MVATGDATGRLDGDVAETASAEDGQHGVTGFVVGDAFEAWDAPTVVLVRVLAHVALGGIRGRSSPTMR